MQYEGAEDFIVVEFVRLWDLDELIGHNEGYQIVKNLPDTIGIGSNGSGEFIALVKAEGRFSIVLSPYIDLDAQYHITIGSSFTDFLERLERGVEWFDA